MSFLDYFRPKKKPVEQPVPEPVHKPKVTYGFMFKYHLNYKNEQGKVDSYHWTSSIYKDHNEAQMEAFKIIEDITKKVNQTVSPDDFVCIIDATLKKSSFVNATAIDVTLITFHDGVAVKATDIAVANGDNIVIKNVDGNEILEGNFKIMVESTNW